MELDAIFTSGNGSPAEYRYSCVTIAGRRANNEDNIYCNGQASVSVDTVGTSVSEFIGSGTASADSISLFAVCDGMGGEACGEVASGISASEAGNLHKVLKGNPSGEPVRTLIDNYIHAINDTVVAKIAQLGVNRMGSTIALACIDHGRLYVSNVGDSRVYLFRAGKLHQLTIDDTEARRLCDEGYLTPDAARHHPTNCMLLQYIGLPKYENILFPHNVDDYTFEPGDLIVLCSDGVEDGIDAEQLSSVIKSHLADTEADSEFSASLSQKIAASAFEHGSKDNISVIVVQF